MTDKKNQQPSPVAHQSLADVPVDQACRNSLILLDAAARKLAETEEVRAGLNEAPLQSWRSACHPESGVTSISLKIAVLRKSLARAKV